MKKVLLWSVILIMVFSLCACGKKAPSGPQTVDSGNIAQTKPVDGGFDGTEAPVVTAEPTATPEPLVTDDPTVEPTPEVTPEPEGQTAAFGYELGKLVISSDPTHNLVIYGASLYSGFDTWRRFLNDEDADAVRRFIGRDYLSLNPSGELRYINSVWIDSNVSMYEQVDPLLTDVIHKIDFSDPMASIVCSRFVSEATNGWISYQPSAFGSEEPIAFVNTVSYSAAWSGGVRNYDDKQRVFYNADGSQVSTYMLRDEGLNYWDLGNAVAYKMHMDDGNSLLVVLPNKGVDMTEVDVSAVLENRVPLKTAHVRFCAPLFAAESVYRITPESLGMGAYGLDTERITGIDGSFVPVFVQYARFDFGISGVNGAVSEDHAEPVPSEYNDDYDIINMICDRPFIYMVIDETNDVVAMAGILNHLDDGVQEIEPTSEPEVEPTEEPADVTPEPTDGGEG